jgi:4-amino-4-deoxy-L-arabinose transferase-like glycosyltransferase
MGSRIVTDRFMTRPQSLRSLPFALHAAIAALAGLALRLFLVLRFPAGAGDSAIYEELAQNWLHEHVYGIFYASGLTPSDMRVPGYPAFLVLIDFLFRRAQVPVVLAQALLDLATCFLVAWLASRLAPKAQRSRVALAALWLAALCPLVANYAAVPLPEVLATFLTAAALIPMVSACIALEGNDAGVGERSPWNIPWKSWFAAGLLVGLATLVRPESPLLLAALALVLIVRWRRRADWGKLARAGALTAMGLVLPLAPWAARNWARFHEVQFVAPGYAASPDEYTPRGLYAWTATWLVRFRDVYLVPWHIDGERVEIGDVSPAAFDSPAERARVAALLDQYNTTLRMTPEVDQGFASLARERTARNPLRTYLFVPLGRVATLWFTPRTELLPVSGHLWPIRQEWSEDPLGFSVTVFLGALNFFYVGLAIAGLWRAHRQRDVLGPGVRTAVMLVVVWIVVRTAFLTQVETPEPRYVLECFPALLALGALVWLPRTTRR